MTSVSIALADGGSSAGTRASSLAYSAQAVKPMQPIMESSVLIELVGKVQELQQALALIDCHPLLALPEAAELISTHLRADTVGIVAYAEGEAQCSVLLAAHGDGSALLERHIVMRGPEWSATCLKASGGSRLVVPDASSMQLNLPTDCATLYRDVGLRSFAAIAVGAPSCDPVGALLLGSTEPGRFDDDASLLRLGAAATGLLQHMRPSHMSQAVRMLLAIDKEQDPVAAVSALLQGAAQFMWRATNIAMGVRLALVEVEADEALIFEAARPAQPMMDSPDGGTGSPATPADDPLDCHLAPSTDPAADVAVSQLPLHNTLLQSAINLGQARFVRDCVAYHQNNPSPASDVFTQQAVAPVSSVVVVPLAAGSAGAGQGGGVVGALYFTQALPCDFDNIQEALLGLVNCVTLILQQKLAGQAQALKSMAEQAQQEHAEALAQAISAANSSAEGHVSPFANAAAQPFGHPPAAAAAAPAAAASSADEPSPFPSPRSMPTPRVPLASPLPGGPSPPGSAPMSRAGSSSRLFRVSSSKRICTDAMVKALSQEIRRRGRHSLDMADLVLAEPLGQGGFGKVYKGTWHRRPAAIKVMNARTTHSEAVSDAMEMAVLSSVQHPNIVQVYSCLTDMVELPRGFDSANSLASVGGYKAPRYRRMLPGEDGNDNMRTYNVVVMEYCDQGTLAEAVMRTRLFHSTLHDGSIGVNLPAIVDVMTDVAHSLRYLHSMGVLHGDIKLDNVLLKTDHLRPLGFVPKLADFGLTKLLKNSLDVINLTGAGTVTHLAPELLQAGTKVTTAVDVYALGILLWEMYTGKRAFAGLPRTAVIDRVLRHGARPSFPPAAPAAYVKLAASCWATSPQDRPALAEIAQQLRDLADTLATEGAGHEAAGGLVPLKGSSASCPV